MSGQSIKYINTNLSKTHRLLTFLLYEKDLFLAIGKSSPWINDGNPSYPNPSLTSIIDPLAYIRIKEAHPVVEGPCGNIIINDNRYSIININDIKYRDGIYMPSPTKLLIRVDIYPNYYQGDSFRTIGLYSRLKLSYGVNTNEISFSPSQVIQPGILHWIAHCSPLYKIEGKKQVLELTIEV